MDIISGYELFISFDSEELTKTQVNIFMEEVYDLFETSDVVSSKLKPIIKNDNISGYALSVIFDSKEMNKTQIDILMVDINDLFVNSDSIKIKLEPIVEDSLEQDNSKKKYLLEDLLKNCNDGNRHEEMITDTQGKELL